MDGCLNYMARLYPEQNNSQHEPNITNSTQKFKNYRNWHLLLITSYSSEMPKFIKNIYFEYNKF